MRMIKIILAIILCILIMLVVFVFFWKPFGKKASKEKLESYSLRNEWFEDGKFNSIESFNVLENFNSKYERNYKYKPSGEIPVKEIDIIENADEEDLNYIWFGHSSGMLQISGYNILIDPVFSDYASPLAPFGPKRIAKIPISSDKLPNIDVV